MTYTWEAVIDPNNNEQDISCEDFEQLLQEKALNNDTLELISAGKFKLDFQPAFDLDRETEIKQKLNEKIERAKQVEEESYR